MRRKKEILFIILILVITLVLVLLPFFINHKEKEVTKTTTNSQTITIKIVGEINYYENEFDDTSIINEISLIMPKGVSMGDINRVIKIYYTKYSIPPINYQTRYFKDTTITINSSYINKEEDIDIVDSTKVNINTATIKELKTLYGIGDVRAEILIEYRETKKIESYQELKAILGVSDEIIEIIKESSVL